MVQIETYNPYEIDIKFDLEEGDITVVDVEADFGQDTALMVANPLKKGDYVALSTTSKTVKKAAAGDVVIGQLIDNPSWNKVRPSEDTTAGNYQKRIGTIRLNCDYVHAVKLDPTSEKAIAVGDPIKYVGNNLFDKSTTANGTMSLYSAAALSGDKITVMYGVRPM